MTQHHHKRFTSWGQALATLRAKRNLSHADVVRTIVGTSRDDVRAWERSESVPTRYQLRGLYKMIPQLAYFTDLLPRETIKSLEAAAAVAESTAATVIGRDRASTIPGVGVGSDKGNGLPIPFDLMTAATHDELAALHRQAWTPPRADPKTAPKGEIDPLPTPRTFGEYVRDWRLNAGLTQEELAELVGVDSGNSVSTWERGTSVPSAESLSRLREQIPGLPQPDGTTTAVAKPPGNRTGNPGNPGNRIGHDGSNSVNAWRGRVRDALSKARTDHSIEGALRAAIAELVESGTPARVVMDAIGDAIKFAEVVRRSLPVYVAEHERSMPGAKADASGVITVPAGAVMVPQIPLVDPPPPIVVPDLPGVAGAGVRYAAAIQAREQETGRRVAAERAFEEAKMMEEIAQEEVTKAHEQLMAAAREGVIA